MEKSFFFNAVTTGDTPDRVYTAADIAAKDACLISNGVLGKSALAVHPGGNAVIVSPGSAIIDGYTYLNTAHVTLDVSSGHSTYDRIDTVCVKLDLTARAMTAVLLKGSASASPVSSVPAATSSVEYLPLAEIRVPAGSTPEVDEAMITDIRIFGGIATAKEQLEIALKEYLGVIDPLDAEEAAALRTLIDTVKLNGNADTVLCGDGLYRSLTPKRELALMYDGPVTDTLYLADIPSVDDRYDIELQGAGGGGGSYDGTSKRGGGGGGGAYVYLKDVKLRDTSYNITVGTGGAGGLGGDGADGGATSLGGFIAEGGKGGKGDSAGGAGGAGGIFSGNGGKDGSPDPAEGEMYGTSGAGGDSPFGKGAASYPGFIATPGKTAAVSGAGGSGASCNAGAADMQGGRGGHGAICIYRYVISGEEA